jgi:peptidoglycan/xylan/chitin deacetylase (PgdA/CDA1 family)
LRHLKDELPEALLNRHVAYLRRRYRLCRFADVQTIPHGCTLTFDDGLSSIYDWLMRARIPAIAFVNSAVLDGKTLLWQHRLSYLMSKYGVDEVADACAVSAENGFMLIDYIQHHFAAFSPLLNSLMTQFGENEATVAQREAIYLSAAQLRDLVRAGIDIGSHTAHHLPLAHVPRIQAHWEIHETRGALDVATVNALSFPFGMRSDYGDAACQLARETYDTVLEVGDGCNYPPRLPNVLGRVGLGTQHQTDRDLYTAIEVQPTIKRALRRLRH